MRRLAATLLAFTMGALAGLFAAVKGGWFDNLLGRTADVIMSIPSLIFALLMLSIFGTNLVVIVIVVAVIYSPRVFRLTRAVADTVPVPVIASGGGGSPESLAAALDDGPGGGHAQAALAASIFHFKEWTVPAVKRRLAELGIAVRLPREEAG